MISWQLDIVESRGRSARDFRANINHHSMERIDRYPHDEAGRKQNLNGYASLSAAGNAISTPSEWQPDPGNVALHL
jgi:hypothetical protein